MSLKRALSVDAILRKKFFEMPVKGAFKSLLGRPVRSGVWCIRGESAHGKTTFIMDMVKELAPHGKIHYNSREEGNRKGLQDLIIDMNLLAIKTRLQVSMDTMEELTLRLRTRKSPEIVVLDSIPYHFLTKRIYKQFVEEFESNKLLIFIDHADGKKSTSAIGRDIWFDADVKINVEGFMAFSKSRLSRGIITKPYVIWPEGAKEYWGDKYDI